MSPALPVTLADVRAAADLLADVARVTPVVGSRVLSDRCGGPVRFKCENLQRGGSFKLRGAYVRIARLTPEERAAGVVAASAGNHAQGVALAASLLGCSATVVMPVGAPLPKVAATEGYGATVRLIGDNVEQALAAAAEIAAESGAVLIHPFDHVDVVAGQGSVGLEIGDQVPDVRTIVVPTGGGGLLAGVAAAVGERSGVRVVGVQAAGAAAYPSSLAAGHPVALDGITTMADGIAVALPGEVPFAVVAELVPDVRTVSEESLSRALLLCLERAKLVVEPAGVAGVAAVLDDPQAFEPPVVAILSGGNVDPLLMLRLLRHGLAASGRFVAFRTRMTDRPGALAALLHELGEADANVLEVEHLRTNPRLHVDEAEVYVQIETRGGKHTDAVLGRLRAAGYPLVFG
ncbi:threonine ammonia-lyase [Sporichthya polymorpha]|uniref:threonine ammonia-lyase n=1 Tax=Sporichthya polymorpha TaxID=35751 RepID=UPI0003666154|nr:threonine ammonia-lyase [Sporichthya polymorpha]